MNPRNLRLALFLATASVVALTAVLYGYGPALIALAGGALLLGITLLWSSVQSLTGETPLSLEEALTLGAPSAEEEQKRAILRALKDLEYERSVGKITAEDYQELSSRYRAEAIRLMQDMDQSLGPARDRAEKLFRERLAQDAERKQREQAEREAEPEAPEPEDEDQEDEEEEEEPESSRSEPPPSKRPRSEPPRSGARAHSAPEESESKASALEVQSPAEPEVKS